MNSIDVRIWEIRPLRGKTKTTYQVRWMIRGRQFGKVFATKGQAECRRAELITAQRRGEPFDTETGLPESETRHLQNTVTWYGHAIDFMDMKWPALEPGSRRTLASALATVTLALVADAPGAPDHQTAFRALVNWSFNKTARKASTLPPEKYAAAVEWISRTSLPVAALAQPRTARLAYNATLYDHAGKAFAPDTHRNKMKALSGAIKYAIELNLLGANPLDRISTLPPRKNVTIDRRVVVNPTQARALIDAVWRQGRTGPRLVAFFAVIYYAGLRPSEVLALRSQDCKLPKKGWGTLCFAESTPYVGKNWTDGGDDDSPRKALKRRSTGQSRTVPACPDLVAHLRAHIDEFGTADDGRIFARSDGTPLRYSTYARIWSAARRDALTKTQYDSPLGIRPYDLRHAALSTWLNAGVPAPQIAEWAGHSVEMLLKTYAKCIDGQEDQARKRIAEALGTYDEPESDDEDESLEKDGDADEG